MRILTSSDVRGVDSPAIYRGTNKDPDMDTVTLHLPMSHRISILTIGLLSSVVHSAAKESTLKNSKEEILCG